MSISFNQGRVSRPMSRVGTMLFFSIFLAMGLAATWSLFFRPILKVLDARQWRNTPCDVVASQVKSHSGKNTTYSVDIEYRYEVGGRTYDSHRYDFVGGSSSGGKREQEIVNRYPPGKETTCYVNPSDPDDAVLGRGFTPMMLLGLIPLIFVAVGVGGIAWAIKSPQFIKPAEGAPPWQARPDWAEGRIRSSNKIAMWAMCSFALVWNAISCPILFAVFNPQKREPMMYFFLLFPLAGLFLIILAVRQAKIWWRFGESVFEMISMPGAVGGALTGTIRLSQFINADDGFKLRLRCVRVHSSGDNNSDSVVWEDERVVSLGGTDAVPVAFYLPPDYPETGVLGTSDRIIWRLGAEARISGAEYSAQFEVPVFKIALTQEQVAAAQKLRGEEQAEIAAYRMPDDSPIRIESSPRGGTTFYFPPHRNLGTAIGVTMFFLVWTGGVVGMTYGHAPLVMRIIFGGVDLIVAYAVLALWFGSWNVDVERDQVTITRSLGLWKCVSIVPVADIVEFTTTIDMTSGNTVYRDLRLIRQTGKAVTLAGSIKDHRQADWLAAEMTRCAGITPVSGL